jgi:hypothetical protein
MSTSSTRFILHTLLPTLILLTLISCGPKQEKIEYLAEIEGNTIMLEGELAERITEIRRLKKVTEFLRLYWVSSDNVIFDLSEGDANRDSTLTVSEVENYVTKKVRYYARRTMNRNQNPQVTGNKDKVLFTTK